MPIYEYACPACGLRFERLRPMSRADEVALCPEGHEGARRVPSLFASFSRESNGAATAIAGTGPSCSGCTSGSCSSCSI